MEVNWHIAGPWFVAFLWFVTAMAYRHQAKTLKKIIREIEEKTNTFS